MRLDEAMRGQVEDNLRNADSLMKERLNGAGQVDSVAMWADLLGFRQGIDLANWDAQDLGVQSALRRVAGFHEVALTSLSEEHEIVAMNDAVAIGRDLDPDPALAATQLSHFLARMDAFFERAAAVDFRLDGPGIRAVICMGSRFRLRGNLGWVSSEKNPRRPSFVCPRPIMMNMAFGRAYSVESSHKLKKCCSLYVEYQLLAQYRPTVMEYWQLDPHPVGSFGDYCCVRCEEP